MVKLLGHRYAKAAATDKPNLLPPRHISTLPITACGLRELRLRSQPHSSHPRAARIAHHPRDLRDRVSRRPVEAPRHGDALETNEPYPPRQPDHPLAALAGALVAPLLGGRLRGASSSHSTEEGMSAYGCRRSVRYLTTRTSVTGRQLP